MPLFFFDFCQGGDIDTDEVGVTFENADLAYLQAYEGAASMWSELLRQRQDPRRCAFQVRDARGRVVFYLPFMELLEACTDSARPTKKFVDDHRAAHAVAARTRRLTSDLERSVAHTRTMLSETRRLIATSLSVWDQTTETTRGSRAALSSRAEG